MACRCAACCCAAACWSAADGCETGCCATGCWAIGCCATGAPWTGWAACPLEPGAWTGLGCGRLRPREAPAWAETLVERMRAAIRRCVRIGSPLCLCGCSKVPESRPFRCDVHHSEANWFFVLEARQSQAAHTQCVA